MSCRRVQVTGDLFHGTVPAGAVYVGRAAPGLPASAYANPYKPGRGRPGEPIVRDAAHAVDLFRRMLQASPALVDQARTELAGRDLACWCKLGQPCHGDVLLEYANPTPAAAGIDLTAVAGSVPHLVLRFGPAGAALLSPGGVYRYALTRVWEVGLPTAVYVMLNPSTADATVDDATLRRCRSFARKFGCGSLAVVNAYALRATHPVALTSHHDPVGPDNDHVLAAVTAAAAGRGPVIVAWGTNGTLRRDGRAEHVLKLLHTAGAEPKCLGMTVGGDPRHPVRLPSTATLLPYHPTTGTP